MQFSTMKLDEIVAWYQKKIGTYDKQQWEKTVEQKILDGFTSVTLKTAKLKTELIDVDLVRGSTFPKAKSKQSLLTVIRLAILRYFLLPIYAQWWSVQTSANCFGILLLLYVLQMINWAIYMFNMHRLEHNNNNTGGNVGSVLVNNTNSIDSSNNNNGNVQSDEHLISLSELLIPMSLGLLLSLIHSQIVATNTASSGGNKAAKRRRFSNANTNGKQRSRHHSNHEPRRRKKLVKVRSQESNDTLAAQQQRKSNVATNTISKKSLTNELLTAKCYSYTSAEPIESESKDDINNMLDTSRTVQFTSSGGSSSNSSLKQNSSATSTSITTTCHHNKETNNATMPYCYQVTPINTLQSDLINRKTPLFDANPSVGSADDNQCNVAHKKRNVNWHSPIHNYAIETVEKEQQTSPQSNTTTTNTSESSTPTATQQSNDDAHVAISNNNSSSNSSVNALIACNSPSKTVRIDDCVQEFYDDLMNHTDLQAQNDVASTVVHNVGAGSGVAGSSSGNDNVQNIETIAQRRHIGDDDGFESLNGKSSSGEEMQNVSATSNATTTATTIKTMKNQLRLRLNAGSHHFGDCESATSICRRKGPLHSSESDNELKRSQTTSADDTLHQQSKTAHASRTSLNTNASSEETEEEGDDDGEIISSPASASNNSNYNECTTSATEWLGVTTNSEECSYSSEIDNSDNYKNHQHSDEDGCDLDFTPTTILNPYNITDKISCTIWDQREIKKAQLSVLEISSCIIERVESMPETNDYIYIGIGFSIMLSFVPSFCRLCEATIDAASDKAGDINYFDVPMLLWEKASFSFATLFRLAFGYTQWERTMLIIAFCQRLCLTAALFMIFSVAERTFKQRFLYAKLFSHLTSSRRARKSNVPHFRLNKVRNIKTWLSVRSYLKKRGPQRSVDVIVSAAFIITLLLLAFLSVEWLKDSVRLHSHLNLEALLWSSTIGIFLLRFMTLGNKIHDKYRSVSVLITEQINLYLQIEQKPKKKEELMVANSVLKLAADLLKELETPFKISGLSANPYLFTTIKVVILSALSGVLSEMLGFKLKLHKIKIK